MNKFHIEMSGLMDVAVYATIVALFFLKLLFVQKFLLKRI